MSDTRQADLIRDFVGYLIRTQKIEIFRYAIYVNKEKDAFFVNAVPHFPLVRLKIDNDKNKKILEVALKITENPPELPADSLDRVCTLGVSVTMDQEGKLRVSTDLAPDTLLEQLPAPAREAIQNVHTDLVKGNVALQDQIQAWCNEHSR